MVSENRKFRVWTAFATALLFFVPFESASAVDLPSFCSTFFARFKKEIPAAQRLQILLENPPPGAIHYYWVTGRFNDNDPILPLFRAALGVKPSQREELLALGEKLIEL